MKCYARKVHTTTQTWKSSSTPDFPCVSFGVLDFPRISLLCTSKCIEAAHSRLISLLALFTGNHVPKDDRKRFALGVSIQEALDLILIRCKNLRSHPKVHTKQTAESQQPTCYQAKQAQKTSIATQEGGIIHVKVKAEIWTSFLGYTCRKRCEEKEDLRNQGKHLHYGEENLA